MQESAPMRKIMLLLAFAATACQPPSSQANRGAAEATVNMNDPLVKQLAAESRAKAPVTQAQLQEERTQSTKSDARTAVELENLKARVEALERREITRNLRDAH